MPSTHPRLSLSPFASGHMLKIVNSLIAGVPEGLWEAEIWGFDSYSSHHHLSYHIVFTAGVHKTAEAPKQCGLCSQVLPRTP